MDFIPSHGLLPDKPDSRDFKYSDILGTPETLDVTEKDWDEGIDVFKQLGIDPITQDQGSSSSCVGQGTKSYLRRWLYGLTNDQSEMSARFVYSLIHQPGGGASLRDGVKTVATLGDVTESEMSSYEGGFPPSEAFMISGKTELFLDSAKKADHFNYRVIEGGTDNIDLYAHAVKNFAGCLGGFTGSNNGWCRSVVRPPNPNEARWGHCVDIAAFGRLDVETDGMPVGTKCLFTKNSWGDRYAIQQGRWKGYQAIPELYFKAGEEVAGSGFVKGIHVFNAWVLTPEEILPTNIKVMEFLKKNEGKLVQDSEQSGAFGLVKGGKILVAPKDRVAELVATYITQKEGVPTPKDLWNEAPKETF